MIAKNTNLIPRSLAACLALCLAKARQAGFIALLTSLSITLSACNSDSSDDFTASAGSNGSSGGSSVMEPAFETEQSVLDNAIICSGFENTDKPPVLLVHGTFTAGWEQYDWSYGPVMETMGFDVCTVTYPDRGFGDLQVSAEYVANAIHR
ncbi:MAG: esterase/lipase family protein, partial [Nevskiales bacterium]